MDLNRAEMSIEKCGENHKNDSDGAPGNRTVSSDEDKRLFTFVRERRREYV